jgi:hypothetical protein
VFRDLNEGQIGPLIDLCLERAPGISQLRIRGACRVGRHGTFAPLATSELFKLVADAVGIPVAEFLAELDPASIWHSIIQFNLVGAFRKDPAGRWKLAAWSSGQYARSAPTADAIVTDLYERARRKNGGFLPRAMFDQRYRILEINTWGWPDAANIDFQEIWSHGVYHLYDNRVPMNFCEAVLHAESL